MLHISNFWIDYEYFSQECCLYATGETRMADKKFEARGVTDEELELASLKMRGPK